MVYDALLELPARRADSGKDAARFSLKPNEPISSFLKRLNAAGAAAERYGEPHHNFEAGITAACLKHLRQNFGSFVEPRQPGSLTFRRCLDARGPESAVK